MALLKPPFHAIYCDGLQENGAESKSQDCTNAQYATKASSMKSIYRYINELKRISLVKLPRENYFQLVMKILKVNASLVDQIHHL